MSGLSGGGKNRLHIWVALAHLLLGQGEDRRQHVAENATDGPQTHNLIHGNLLCVPGPPMVR